MTRCSRLIGDGAFRIRADGAGNPIDYSAWSGLPLHILQEVLTLAVFVALAVCCATESRPKSKLAAFGYLAATDASRLRSRTH